MFNREVGETDAEVTFINKSYDNNHPNTHDYGNDGFSANGWKQNKMHYNIIFVQVFLPLTQPLVKLLNFSVAS
jgi:hypothetical protein